MQTKLNKFWQVVSLGFALMIVSTAYGERFISNYPCSDGVKTCLSKGERVVDGLKVHRDCWEWGYVKTCNYPSKNDCARHRRCYSLGQVDCFLRDSMGNCVNAKMEFSCKRWTPTYVESETVRYGTKDIEGKEGLVCKGIPCIDGNCVDKSYDMDGDMVSSLGQLGALSQGKNMGTAGFKIFEAVGRSCSKKGMEYSNCCQVFPKGWGKNLGAKCGRDEVILSEQRQKNLCVPAGSEAIRAGPIKIGTKHHYCCWSNLLEKTIQVQARKQLGIAFTQGSSPNCRGLTFDELKRVDFSRMDFSEVAAEMFKKIKLPNINDIEGRVKDNFRTTIKFDDKIPAHSKNRAAGVNPKAMGE